jgi:hypothetical protein
MLRVGGIYTLCLGGCVPKLMVIAHASHLHAAGVAARKQLLLCEGNAMRPADTVFDGVVGQCCQGYACVSEGHCLCQPT